MTPPVTRRSLLGAAGAGAAAALAPGATAAATAERPFAARGERPRRRPNLLVVLADDMGWADLSCYGAPTIRTPNLDRLARRGVRFTQGYSVAPVCSPTRIGLYTGRYPGRLPAGLREPISAPSAVDGIPLDHPTLASLLRDAGYDTAMIGKWHCGFLPWFSPTRLGWDSFFGNFSGGIDYFSKLSGSGAYDLYEDEVEHEDLRYYTHVLTERAEEFLEAPHARPWLLNLNYTTPHWPWEGPRDRGVSDELSARVRAGDRSALVHRDGGSVEKYTEMVEDLDRSLGRVLAALRRTGQERDTLVLFASDNGGERFSNTWPLSGEKLTVLEGGIRVPTILTWPAGLDGQQVSDVPVGTLDWHATLLELGGARPDVDHPLDGVSLVDHLLLGRRPPRRDLFWRLRDQGALRRGRLKYVRDSAGAEHLYDVEADQREQADLAARRPEDLAALRAAWRAVDATLLPYPA
ncbi:sulfatase-like hydrolase/transferase [Vallicoccus soli]|uniref:Twin-arginine translocation pathway signal protein n=1 Tax=Vallicoccus soli TaxID=2339232 RepID=A0A3A3Z1N4_9ACTN|nr:sulfatase-like hydrolase/transferase [Vallicoccus soli]RJK96437.1 twin-arginine translocation pathway signal protein [Vallicoccus soli]